MWDGEGGKKVSGKYKQFEIINDTELICTGERKMERIANEWISIKFQHEESWKFNKEKY